MKRVIVALFALFPIAALAFTAVPPGIPNPLTVKKAANAVARQDFNDSRAICALVIDKSARAACVKTATATYDAAGKAIAAAYKLNLAAYKPLQAAAQVAWAAENARCKTLPAPARSACTEANNTHFGG
jgi:hypothetical protein